MAENHPADFIVLGLDIIKYSEKDMLGQKLSQERVDRCLNEALNAKWKNGLMPHWVDAGDGGYALFQGSEIDVLEVLQEFYLRIERENRPPAIENKDKVLVRSAIHKDKVIVWDTKIGDRHVKKFTGHAINNCARLMAGMIKDHDCQVVCSRPVLDALMLMDEMVSPTRLKDIKDKHGHSHEVWNLLISPVLGVKPIQKELYPDSLLRPYSGSAA